MDFSRAQNWSEIEEMAAGVMQDDGFALAYFYDKILFGDFRNKNLTLLQEADFDNLTELHIFNSAEEFRAVKSEQEKSFLLRYIRDDNEQHEYFDESQYLINKIAKPKSAENCDKLIIRNYFDFSQDNLLFIKDYRLAGFERS